MSASPVQVGNQATANLCFPPALALEGVKSRKRPVLSLLAKGSVADVKDERLDLCLRDRKAIVGLPAVDAFSLLHCQSGDSGAERSVGLWCHDGLRVVVLPALATEEILSEAVAVAPHVIIASCSLAKRSASVCAALRDFTGGLLIISEHEDEDQQILLELGITSQQRSIMGAKGTLLFEDVPLVNQSQDKKATLELAEPQQQVPSQEKEQEEEECGFDMDDIDLFAEVKPKEGILFNVCANTWLPAVQSCHTTGLSLKRTNRVAAVGEAGAIILELLMNNREVKGITRSQDLVVAFVGPIIGATTGEEHEAGLQATLAQRPNVLVVDEAAGNSEAWGVFFDRLLAGNSLADFAGAVVLCVAQETLGIRGLCSERCVLKHGWLWQEGILSRETMVVDDGWAHCGVEGTSLLRKEFRSLWSEYFDEPNDIEKAERQSWQLALLIQPGEERCAGTFCGFMCYWVKNMDWHIERIAVNTAVQKSGFGTRLLHFALTQAAQLPSSECEWISLNAVETAVPFYERVGFKRLGFSAQARQDMLMENRSVVDNVV